MDDNIPQDAAVEELRQKMNQLHWWHTIDLGRGLVTPGKLSAQQMKPKIEGVFGPLNLAGKSVLDVGAWNGAYSIEAKRRGAGEVVALDYVTWRNKKLRGRESFEFAVQCAGFEIRGIERDIAVPNALADLPVFDVVLFLGVFYHLVDPIHVLQQLGRIAGECLVVETHIVHLPSNEPAMVFYPTSELNNDPTNWWGPNVACVEALLRTVGFKRIDTKLLGEGRGLFHAWK